MNWFEDLFLDEAKHALNKHQGGGGSGGPSAKPDYNQNDPNAPDYIKNRPFYTGEPEEMVLYDGEVGAGESELLPDGTRVYFSDMDYYAPGLDFVIGQQYTVVFDGVTYDVTAWDGRGLGCIGNTSIANFEAYDDSQPPFCIVNGMFVSVSDNFSDNYTYPIKISTVQSKINPIDIKYIPEMYGMVGPVKLTGGDYYTVYPDDTYNWVFDNLDYGFSIVENGEYKVIWNGTEYLCTAAYDYDDDSYYIGNPRHFAWGNEDYPDNGMPFAFFGYPGETITLLIPNPDEEITCEYIIETETKVPSKIPVEYMPDEVAWSFEDLFFSTNELRNMIEDVDATVDATVDAAVDAAKSAAAHVYPVSISGSVATVIGNLSLVDGYLYIFIPQSSGNVGSASIKLLNNSYYVRPGISTHNVTGYSAINLSSDVIFREGVPTVVVYSDKNKCFYCFSKISPTFVETKSATSSKSVPNYIYGYYTDNIAQKYVYMRVKSSTPDSKKLFDITVDDNGTISAVEVV